MIIPGDAYSMLAEWSLILVAVISGGLSAHAYRRRRKLLRGACWRCSYDLRGSVSANCPECGADLKQYRWLRLRRIYGHLFVCCSLLATACAIAIVFAIILSINGFSWNAIKPSWWLIEELDGSNPDVIVAALEEVEGRYNSGSLSSNDIHLIVKAILWRQVRGSYPFTYEDTVIIDHLYERGDIPHADYVSYCRNAIIIEAFAVEVDDGNYDINLRIGEGRGAWSSYIITMAPVIVYPVDDLYVDYFNSGVSVYDGFHVQFPVDQRDLSIVMRNGMPSEVHVKLKFIFWRQSVKIGEWQVAATCNVRNGK